MKVSASPSVAPFSEVAATHVVMNEPAIYIGDKGPATRPNQERVTCDRDTKTIKRSAHEGALLGFRIGAALTLLGIPLANYAQDIHEKRPSLKARKARKRILLAVLWVPGVLVGGLGAAIGAAIGAVAGSYKVARPNLRL